MGGFFTCGLVNHQSAVSPPRPIPGANSSDELVRSYVVDETDEPVYRGYTSDPNRILLNYEYNYRRSARFNIDTGEQLD